MRENANAFGPLAPAEGPASRSVGVRRGVAIGCEWDSPKGIVFGPLPAQGIKSPPSDGGGLSAIRGVLSTVVMLRLGGAGVKVGPAPVVGQFEFSRCILGR